jgi:hypothetical protein
LDHGVDEALRRADGCIGFSGGDRYRGCPNRVIGSRLELVGGAKKGNEVTVDARLYSCQPRKFAADAPMRFRDLAGLFEYLSLRCVKHREVGFAGGNVRLRVGPQSAGRRQAWCGPWRDNRRFPPSQKEAILAQLVHEAGALAVVTAASRALSSAKPPTSLMDTATS